MFFAMPNTIYAIYNFDGFPITWYIKGEIHGDIFIDGGHGIDGTPYIEDFSIPGSAGRKIYWAGVFIGVWGGDEYNTGWVQAQINDTKTNIYNLKGVNDKNENVLCSGHGVYLVHYNITSFVSLNSTLRIEVNTGGVSLDGRVYGMVLIVIYQEEDNNYIKFEIGFGNVGLHYMIQGVSYNEFIYNFKDTYNVSKFDNSILYTSQLATTNGENDYLYYNGHLLDSNSGDESQGSYFDLDSYNVSEMLNNSNSVEFSRDSEGYIHPTIVLLKSKYKSGEFIDEENIEYNIETHGSHPYGFNMLYIIAPLVLIITISIFVIQYYRKKNNTNI
ncbi:MAG: DUF3344 domain-containing protein [Candidatus Lokiarchaeota archaeon]|nr:DUF3344 domain-containing protein [Candidatus Lokiarchaeota archaeon]